MIAVIPILYLPGDVSSHCPISPGGRAGSIRAEISTPPDYRETECLGLTKSVFRLMIWEDQPLKPKTSLARLIAVRMVVRARFK